MNRRAGWHVEYRQIEAGSLRTASSLREVDGVSILRERSDRRLELAAQPPDEMLSVVMPAAQDRMTFNGSRMGPGTFSVFAEGAELIGVTHGAAEATSLQIPAAVFASHQRSLVPDRRLPDRGRAETVREPAGNDGRLRALLEAAWRVDLTGFAATEFASSLVSAVIEGVYCDAPVTPRATAHHHEILRVAREYIEAHLARPIRMADVCKAAETSLSTLERAFRRELLLTPLQYVRARRLNAVRKVLKSPAARNRSIARIATGYGFGHLGRFSHDYRQHFGELPSESRRASRINGPRSSSSGLATSCP